MRAQGNSMWIIIFAVIALVVLVVLLFIFQGGVKRFDAGAGKIQSGFYRCVCDAPLTDKVCAELSPCGVGEVCSKVDAPSGCDGWDDCSTVCWEKE